MNYTNMLKRAWHILWHYPALWVFGFILALTGGGSSGGGGNGGGSGTANFDPSDNYRGLPDHPFFNQIEEHFENMVRFFENLEFETIIPWIIVFVVAMFLLGIAFTFLRNLALTANFKMVDHYEETGEKVKWTKGFRWGWSRHMWQLFLMDWIIGIPLFILFLIAGACVVLPFMLIATENAGASVVGVVAGIGLGIFFILLLIVLSVIVGLWMRMAKRANVLGGKGIFESLGEGWKLARAYWKDVLITWLIMIGVNIAFGIATFIVGVLLIVISILLGGGIGFVVWALSQGALASIIVAFLIFMTFISITGSFVGGFGETYNETIWTLVYRETQTPQSVEALPELPDGPEFSEA